MLLREILIYYSGLFDMNYSLLLIVFNFYPLAVTYLSF